MNPSLRVSRRFVLALAGTIAVAALSTGQARASFQIGLEFGTQANGTSAQIADAALRTIDGSIVRVPINWASVAPNTTTMPAGFDPSNPGDHHYDWGEVDAAVRAADQLHGRVILYFYDAPDWAEGPNRPPYTNPLSIYPGAWDPSPVAFEELAHAAAVRYSGNYPDPLHPGRALPRVKYWEIWNEENLPAYLAAPDLVGEYRALLNAGYGAIKAINQSNVIVLGGLASVSYEPPLSLAPLQFAADLLCLHQVGTHFAADQSCQRAKFDVLSIHPYTLAATPTKHAYAYDNVLVGDMGKVKSLVATANRMRSGPRIQIWVTEFEWFTDPPNTVVGDTPRVAARYVAYSLYELWRSGVQVVIWLNAEDVPNSDILGGGLYTTSGAPKLMLSAYAFPFIASVRGGGGFAWGRVPTSGKRTVQVQRLAGGRWRTVATARTAPDGVFEVRFHARGNAFYRAQVVSGPTSLAYNSRPIPPRRTHLFYSG